MAISHWIVSSPTSKPKRCLLALPGRGNPADLMLRVARDFKLPDTLIVAVQPYNFCWYPQPMSPDDQQKALSGLAPARIELINLVNEICKRWKLKTKDIAAFGFSAGAVMALEVGTRINLGAVVAIAGAILEPLLLPLNAFKRIKTPIYLSHNKDDNCFDWDERYLPMKAALLKNKYNVTFNESSYGGHTIYLNNIIESSEFIASKMFSADWKHPKSYKLKMLKEENDSPAEPENSKEN